VVLVGLMGSGKTTVGRLLAERLGRPLVDNDEELEGRSGATAAEIEERDGRQVLHGLEAEILLDAMESNTASVIVAAGSVVEDPSCLDRLRSPAAMVVWLRGTPAELAERAASSSHRPTGGGIEATLAQQAERRGPRFAEIAGQVVDVDVATPEEIADLVAHRLAG
jgi:shikimate kinase